MEEGSGVERAKVWSSSIKYGRTIKFNSAYRLSCIGAGHPLYDQCRRDVDETSKRFKK
jgi:hypothetical protein